MATLSDLRTRLDLYVNRTDVDYTANRDYYLNAGLRWLQREFLPLKAFATQWTSTQTVSAGTEALPLPPDYRSSGEVRIYRLQGDERLPMSRIPLAWLEEPFYDVNLKAQMNLSNTSQRGTPVYFALRGRSAELRPVPADTTVLQLHGVSTLEALVHPQDDNLLTCEAEDACLYAGLRETWLTLGDEAERTKWEAQAKEAITRWMADREHEAGLDHDLVMETPG